MYFGPLQVTAAFSWQGRSRKTALPPAYRASKSEAPILAPPQSCSC